MAKKSERNEARATAKAVGAVLFELRQAKGLSQEALAEKANCHINNISLLERGERTASIHTLRTVAEALGKTASYVLKTAGY